MHDSLEAALTAAPAQVFGLLNHHGVVSEPLHRAPNTVLAAAGALDQKSILPERVNSIIKFKGAATAIVPIPRPESSEVNMQSSRYALREKLLAAKNLDQVWA